MNDSNNNQNAQASIQLAVIGYVTIVVLSISFAIGAFLYAMDVQERSDKLQAQHDIQLERYTRSGLYERDKTYEAIEVARISVDVLETMMKDMPDVNQVETKVMQIMNDIKRLSTGTRLRSSNEYLIANDCHGGEGCATPYGIGGPDE